MDLAIELISSLTGFTEALLANLFSFIGLVATVLITPLGAVYAYWKYRTRRFTDQITVSNNYFEENDEGELILRIRNSQMLPLSDVLPENAHFKLALWRAIRRCTLDDPFIQMSYSDMDILQPSVINAISAISASGIFARSVGRIVPSEYLYLAVTFEKDGQMKNQKIRVMLDSEGELERLSKSNFRARVRFERSHHAYRLVTLQKMAHKLEQEKRLSDDDYKIIRRVEVFP